MRVAVYPGSFDPITNGHLDVIKRAAALFDKVVVGILINQSKRPMFSLEERAEIIREILKDMPNVEVAYFSGLVVDFAREHGANVLIRGLRSAVDFEYEFQMAQINRDLAPEVDTLFLASDPSYSYISSSAVKELVSFQQDVTKYVPGYVIERLKEKESQHE